jgi:cellulose synthase (UDP-forming)
VSTGPNPATRISPAVLLGRLLLSVGSCTGLYLLATVPLEWKEQAILSLALICLVGVLSRISKSQGVTLFISVLSMFSTVRYAHYRFSQTFQYLSFNWAETHAIDLFFVFLLLAAETYAFVILFLGVFQTIRPLNREPLPLSDDLALWPSVDVYIPTYNEPLDVVRATTLAAMSMDWPLDKLNVYILDDGRRSEFREFAERCQVGYLIRPDNKHAKAGNINHALKQTKGEYVAIFDCDHIPTRSFLQVAMGWFNKDERLAMVQTPHHFYSPDPFERNLGTFRQIPNEGALFYGIIQDGSDFWNATFFCGSCAVLRRPAIEEIGGIAVETVTEDAHTALRMQRRGWNTAYIRIPQAAGLATGSLAAHIGQRIRWARGMVQILRTDNPLFGKGLNLAQRLCYLNSMMHYLFAVPRLIFLVSPAVFLLLGRSNIYGYGKAILAYAIPHLVFAVMMNSRVQGRYRYSFWNEVYETVLAPFILMPTMVALVNPKLGSFNVTSKEDVIDERYFEWKLGAPYLALLSLNIACVVAAAVKIAAGTLSRQTLALNLLWSVLNIIIVGVAVAVAYEATQRRSNVRISARVPVSVASGTYRWNTTTVDISRGGISIPLPGDWDLNPGDRLKCIFETAGEEHTFPMVLVANEDTTARFGFGILSLAEEDALVGVIFGRADAWLNWRESTRDDRPLLSFLNIVGIALQGIAVIPGALIALLGRPSRGVAKPVVLVVRRTLVPLLAIAFGLGSIAMRAAVPTGVAAPAAKATFSDSLDLVALGQKNALSLEGAQARANLNFGLPLTKVVTQATLLLNYRASVALAATVSVVNVALNGQQIASVPVTQSPVPETLTSVEVPIPADLLISDNTLSLTLDGRCAPGCNGGTAKDLWLRIEPSTQLRLAGSIFALRNDLRLLPAPFFDRTRRRAGIAQVAFDESPDHQTLEAGGVIASWFGQLADDRGLRFAVTVGAIPGGDVIVFALLHSAVAVAAGLDSGEGPMIALRDNPSDAYGKMLIITGRDSNDLLTASRALASGRYPRAGSSASLGSFRLPPARAAYDAPHWLNTSHTTPLGRGMSAEDLRVYGNGSVNLYFQLPPDLYFGRQTYVPLHLAYEINKWPASATGVLRVRLNGALVTTRRIANGGHQDQNIGLPVAGLTPGNTLNVEFASDSHQPQSAQAVPEENVSSASTIDLGGLAHFVELPRLDLFANAGFPFTNQADLAGTAVVLVDDSSPGQLGFYLDVMGFLGARTGYPALRISVLSPTQSAELAGKDLIILSTTAAAPESLNRLVLGPARIDQGQISLHETSSALSKFSWLSWAVPTAPRDADEVVSADPRPDGFVSEFAMPGNHTAVVIAAADVSKLAPLEDVFARETTIAQVYGNLSLIQGGQFHSFLLGSKSYGQGSLGTIEHFYLWMISFYWTLPVFLFAIAALLAVSFNRWLEERARFRLQSEL